jgi:hypothetical protein
MMDLPSENESIREEMISSLFYIFLQINLSLQKFLDHH